MHCFKKAVCVKIASSIMPGVKMLRQNFVSASNKSPKDKRFEIINLSDFFLKLLFYFKELEKNGYWRQKWILGSIADETAGYFSNGTLSPVTKANLLSRSERCTIFLLWNIFITFLFSYFYIFGCFFFKDIFSGTI